VSAVSGGGEMCFSVRTSDMASFYGRTEKFNSW
jgi:hypothetical protein